MSDAEICKECTRIGAIDANLAVLLYIIIFRFELSGG